ncbi:AMP-binding protein [uncultured Hyphomonas sp.]|uniref:class I adenylate-forming enzyme family protein n=1 Tax=uncultured Hyphomonas sp. TaxID=225298 RepID=UPI002AAAE0F7|nr:AMP-binding protein [uncultured Hyphomonas sp.]
MSDTTMETLSTRIRSHAVEAPEATALTIGPDSLSYRQLDSLCDRTAMALDRSGVCPGDYVGIAGKPSITQVAALAGLTRLGGVPVPIPSSARADDQNTMLADSGARFCFADAGTDIVLPEVSLLPLARTAFEDWLPHRAMPFADHNPVPEAPATIIYSSGTTGTPKGIVQPHSYRSRIIQSGPARGYTPDAVTMIATPLYSNTTLVAFLGTLGVGGHIVMMPKFDAEDWLKLAEHHRATHAMLVPVMIDRILTHPDFDNTDLSSFRMKYCTSAPFSASLKRAVLDRWPGGLTEFYGMTEGGASFILRAHEHPDKLHTVGQLSPGSEIRLLDDNDQDVGPHQPGEVVGRSPGMMLGYHKRPDATAGIFWTAPDGSTWLRTGDIGKLDEDGFLSIIDRKKDLIISGGFNIYPADIEAVLSQHPDVQETSVVGVPDPRWGETPVAFVVGPQDSPDAIKTWLNDRLGKMQRVSSVCIVSALPRNAIGKIVKTELKNAFLSTPT